MNFTRIGKLSKLVTNNIKRKPKIVLDPDQSYRIHGTADDINLNIDTDNWIIPDELNPFISELAKSDECIEEKIIKMYQKLCEDYTYDDNVLSYIKMNDDETFFLPDEYGRDTDYAWREKRKQHNRRNCFEISRILAKSLNEILQQSGCSKQCDVCILWDEAVTHYFVGLISNEYCVSLDLDDFTQIKDLTRIKTGLTIEGIKILDDPSNKFRSILSQFNNERDVIAKDHIESKIANDSINQKNDTNMDDDIEFLKYSVQILKEEYNLDSAGIFEYIREIVDTRIGAQSRRKIWKEVETNPGTGTRYTRCLIVKIDDDSFIIDVTKENVNEIFREVDPEELNNSDSKVAPFEGFSRDWNDDPYDGR